MSLGLGRSGESSSGAGAFSSLGMGGRIPSKPRFSLFAAPSAPTNLLDRQTSRDSNPQVVEEEEEEEPQEESFVDEGQDESFAEGDQTYRDGVEEEEVEPEETPAQREQKLRESLYELKQMNEVFEGFLGALESAKGHNEVRCVTQYQE